MDKKKEGYDKVFRALGDVHRIEILELLIEGEMNAGELLDAVDVVQSTLSHHMKSLCESGLVRARKAGRWTYYAVSQERILEARQFLARYLDSESIEQDRKVSAQVTISAQKDVSAKKTVPALEAAVMDYSKKKFRTENEKSEKEKPEKEKTEKVKKEKSKDGKKENKKDEKKKGKKQKKNGKK